MPLPLKFAVLGIAAIFGAACAVCHAQAWPGKPVRMLVGFPPGGPTDVIARLVSEKVAGQFGEGQPRRPHAAVFIERDSALAGSLLEARVRSAEGHRAGH